MNKLIVVLATVTGAAITDSFLTRRRNKQLADRANVSIMERGEIALRWFHVGSEIALGDKRAVKEAHDKLFPTTPAPAES